MTTIPATIRIMNALHQAALHQQEKEGVLLDTETGIFIIGRPEDSTNVLRGIAEELDYRIEIIDSDRTNLADLEVFDSPLRRLARHADASDLTYMFVLRGWSDDMADDARIGNFRRFYGGSGIAVILSEDAFTAPDGFVTCDLSSL
ncbi:hypothetical protein [Sphingomonas sp. 3-13AW]|uniref:hypothetical protein n=1 Tax=Sphingomonas sp. 3-13AW TaxID=3050450 RepID=UPI003BB6FF56